MTTPFQSFAWIAHWQKTVGGPLLNMKPEVIRLHTDGETIAILPLGIRKNYGIRILEWLGGGETDYMGPLILPEWDNFINTKKFDCKNITDKLNAFDVLHLKKQLNDLSIFGFINNDIMLKTSSLLSYQRSLNSDWETFSKTKIKKRIQTDSRRQYRRLNKIGKVRFFIGKTIDEKKMIIKKMIKQKRKRYQNTGAWDDLKNIEKQKFYLGLAELYDLSSILHCTALYVGDKIVATHVGLVFDKKYYYLMPAHEENGWEKYSCGRLLLENLFEWSFNNEIKTFDFTIGGETYKKTWCNIEKPVFNIIGSKTKAGKIYYYALNIKEFYKSTGWLYRRTKNLLLFFRGT